MHSVVVNVILWENTILAMQYCVLNEVPIVGGLCWKETEHFSGLMLPLELKCNCMLKGKYLLHFHFKNSQGGYAANEDISVEVEYL